MSDEKIVNKGSRLWHKLSPDVFVRLFAYLRAREATRCKVTCKFIRLCLEDKFIWKAICNHASRKSRLQVYQSLRLAAAAAASASADAEAISSQASAASAVDPQAAAADPQAAAAAEGNPAAGTDTGGGSPSLSLVLPSSADVAVSTSFSVIATPSQRPHVDYEGAARLLQAIHELKVGGVR